MQSNIFKKIQKYKIHSILFHDNRDFEYLKISLHQLHPCACCSTSSKTFNILDMTVYWFAPWSPAIPTTLPTEEIVAIYDCSSQMVIEHESYLDFEFIH
jgi:hypothetical protein